MLELRSANQQRKAHSKVRQIIQQVRTTIRVLIMQYGARKHRKHTSQRYEKRKEDGAHYA